MKMDIEDDGTRYENLGPDAHGLPMHEHNTHGECHTVEVMAGEIVLFFDKTAIRLTAGDVYRDLDVAQRHGIWPIGPAVWFNRRNDSKQPSWMVNMTEAERHTVVDQRVDLPRWAARLLGI